jgi:hypothetical protein
MVEMGTNTISNSAHQQPYTNNPTPTTLHQKPYTNNPTPTTRHQQPYTNNSTPKTMKLAANRDSAVAVGHTLAPTGASGSRKFGRCQEGHEGVLWKIWMLFKATQGQSHSGNRNFWRTNLISNMKLIAFGF